MDDIEQYLEELDEERKKIKYQVKVRLNEEERALFQINVFESGLSQQEFLKKCALEKPVYNFDEVKELVKELKKQGNNLNQIAKKMNQYQYLDNKEFDKVMKEVCESWQLLKQFLQVRK